MLLRRTLLTALRVRTCLSSAMARHAFSSDSTVLSHLLQVCHDCICTCPKPDDMSSDTQAVARAVTRLRPWAMVYDVKHCWLCRDLA